jgi:serine phosphatase RsbU (regulator of sigma subunit)
MSGMTVGGGQAFSEPETGARLRRLQRIAGSLSRLLTPQAVAEVILGEVAPELGGVSRALWLADEDRTHLRLVRPDDHLRARPFATLALDGDMPGAVVFRTGEPVFMASKAERDAAFPMLAEVGPQVAIAVLPLNDGDDVVGVLALSYDEDHDFSEDERDFFTAVADLASQALARGRLHALQVEVAEALQKTLLPPDLPTIAGVDLAASYHPSWEGIEVGGDFYDVIPLDCGRWLVMIGDVCGTGPAAAAITAQVRHTARTAAKLGLALDRLVAVINESLVETIGDERFCTMVAAVVQPHGAGVSMELVCAGHPCPVVVRRGGEVAQIPSTGSLLGVVSDARFVSEPLVLSDGDALVLYTDGVLEARPQDGDRADFFAAHRLEAALRGAAGQSAAALVGALEASLFSFADRRLNDDVAIVALRAVGAT